MSMEEPDDAPVMKSDARALERKIDGLLRVLSTEIVKSRAASEKLTMDLRGEMRASSSDIFSKIDSFMTEVAKVERAQVIVDWRLTELERRIAAIEPRPS